MKHRAAVVLAGLALVVAGCGSSSSSEAGGATHVMPDGSTMSGDSMPPAGDDMSDDSGSGGAPSATASMICSDEIRSAVRRNLDLARAPLGRHS